MLRMLVLVISYSNSIAATTPVSLKENIDPCSRSYSANKLAEELRELIEVCYSNLLHAQKLQKWAHDKGVKSCSYVLRKKVWLNSKYIKIKKNKKHKHKVFGPFRVLYAIKKQAYKLELPTKRKKHNVLYVSLLEQNTTKKEQVDNTLPKPEKDLEFKDGGKKKYKFEAIIDSGVYSQQANSNDQMSGLYYLILWKSYPGEENTWKPLSVVIYLRKLISTFYKEHLETPTVTFLPFNSALLMARLSVPKEQKQKHGHPSKRVNKRGRK